MLPAPIEQVPTVGYVGLALAKATIGLILTNYVLNLNS